MKKQEFVRQVAERMDTNETTAALWVDAVTETIYERLKAGESVTLPGFGTFYVRPERAQWVFKFTPSQRLRALFGWSSTYKGPR
ncbi:MAG: HU family DNA-binding protein [Chloroflexota bacterium]|nr:HU family DNA-binding protein [Chloroflexota bacterium]